jgi:hypothetical protein
MGPLEAREARALDNMRTAIDMHEMYERISINKHGSFLPHGAIFKVTQDILKVGDPWACGTSPLELQNADTKRVASSISSKRQSIATSGVSTVGRGINKSRAITTKGYSTAMAVSTLKNLLSIQYLRRGDGVFAVPDSRRRERVFGSTGSGRLSLPGTGKKYDITEGYQVRSDTVLKAFVRLLAEQSDLS